MQITEIFISSLLNTCTTNICCNTLSFSNKLFCSLGLKDLELQLRSIKSDSTFDLVCKVLDVHEASNGVWILYVWDGTDTPVTEFPT
jgi:hypothetical protein